MISASPEFQAFLYGANVHQFADLWTFTFSGGIQRWTPAKAAITWGGNTYSPIVISRDKVRHTAHLEIDKLRATLTPGSATLAGVPMRLAAIQGKFHGVGVKLHRCGFNFDGSVVDAVTIFDGRVDDVYTNSTSIGLSVKSLLAFLAEVEIPKRVVEPECTASFCDSLCTLSLASFTTATTVAAGSTAAVLRIPVTQAASYYQLGTVVVGSESRMIRDSADLGGGVHELTLTAALSSVPAVGTSVSVSRGCPKTRDACRGFSNIINFLGFPDTPPPETVY